MPADSAGQDGCLIGLLRLSVVVLIRQQIRHIVSTDLLGALVGVSVESLELAHVVVRSGACYFTLLELNLIVLEFLKLVCTHTEAKTVDVAAVELVCLTVDHLSALVHEVSLAHPLCTHLRLGLRDALILLSVVAHIVIRLVSQGSNHIHIQVLLIVDLDLLIQPTVEWNFLAMLGRWDFHQIVSSTR